VALQMGNDSGNEPRLCPKQTFVIAMVGPRNLGAMLVAVSRGSSIASGSRNGSSNGRDYCQIICLTAG
jgi:hypothetical protein